MILFIVLNIDYYIYSLYVRLLIIYIYINIFFYIYEIELFQYKSIKEIRF